MRIAIAGGTGRIGRLTSAALAQTGHQTVPLSRRAGADAYTGAGLDDALRDHRAAARAADRAGGRGGEALLPGGNAWLGATTFDAWLAAGAPDGR
jgi:uncharacterized protein YbjT (DUF2867 family)